jgi:N-acyl-D-aspartate/D-glutamate deacylase
MSIAQPDVSIRDEFYDRLRVLAPETGVPIAYPTPACHGWIEALALVDSVNARGGRMFGLSHSRGISILWSFKTHLPFDGLAEWQQFRELPLPRQRVALRDSGMRDRLVKAAHHGNFHQALVGGTREPHYDQLRVLRSPYLPNPTVADEAARREVDPVELIIDLALESEFEQFFQQPLCVERPADQVAVMKHPAAIMTFSDSGAHVTQITDSSIFTHLLAYWVREIGAITLEEAVAMITSTPAKTWGLNDRGLLRIGMAADINVFDPALVAPELPTVVHDLPGGSQRLMQRAVGFRATLVNGEVLFEDGEPTDAVAGRLIRGASTERRHLRSTDRDERL